MGKIHWKPSFPVKAATPALDADSYGQANDDLFELLLMRWDNVRAAFGNVHLVPYVRETLVTTGSTGA